MNLLTLACRNLVRRPLRSALAFAGLAVATGTLAVVSSFASTYQRGLRVELDRSGVQLMLVPLGCPYDAAARVLKGRALDSSLPEAVLETARQDPAVAAATPLLLTALVRAANDRTDLWVGIDESVAAVKPWWHAQHGTSWFTSTNSVILGAEAAADELRRPGDLLHSPEMGATFKVAAVLDRSGTSDDSFFFLPLKTAQALTQQPGRLTAVAIRLRDPTLLSEAARRLQAIPGSQVVTMTEIMGVFQNLVATVRVLLMGISVVALTVGGLTVLNTMLAAVMERAGELALLRAVGASRSQICLVLTIEAVVLTTGAAVTGLLGALIGSPWLEAFVRHWIALTPQTSMGGVNSQVIGPCLVLGVGTGLIAVVYPAVRAIRMAPAAAAQPR